MGGGDFSRGMGQEGDPEINAGGTFYSFWSGEPHYGRRSIFILYLNRNLRNLQMQVRSINFSYL